VLKSISVETDKNDPPGRLLALDLGTKTIGLAVSDPGRNISSSLRIIQRRDMASDMAELASVIEEYEIKEMVLGLPLHLSGAESEGSERSRKFAKELEAEFGLPVLLVDESLSTARAEEIMVQANVSRKKRKKKIDGLAAAVILQYYLDEQEELNR